MEWWRLAKTNCESCTETFYTPRYVERTNENDRQWEDVLQSLKFCSNCLVTGNFQFLTSMKQKDICWRKYTSSGIAPYIQDVELLNSYRDSYLTGGKLLVRESKIPDTLHFLDPKSRNLMLPTKKDARLRQSFGLFM
jgi:ribosomal protein L33